MTDGGFMIVGEDRVLLASRLALRGALKLETKGFKRRGTSARMIANRTMGTNHHSARKTYEAFDKWLVENYGVASRPLS